jgi:CDGSH-type Zn-finger protein
MSEESQENKTVVTINKGGPVKVNGLFTITGVNGEKLEVESSNEVYLCACGQSKNKPFCDGSHKRITI